MKNKFIRFCNWAQANWLALIIFMVVLMLIFLCMVLVSWIIGYWSNALYGTKFELGSCWTGVGVVVTGLGGVAALAKAAWTKYGTDSQFNSPAGMHPTQQDVIKNIQSEVMKK
ncbi:hypothetical protein Ga0466249_003391 [Sporomusaceae bacterium BoRhaA]|uniref:hypothetical protein n=1 Tax=Pelorhabdus rhamnosifermentans TaxID=2772457 RepID=UPI001C061855|nr:hypothetical protein [Pelorhabdus rhamnosifermentans]MBU2702264.1 hypothetical protein [Pelorhabdus rhamnosifermentans]